MCAIEPFQAADTLADLCLRGLGGVRAARPLPPPPVRLSKVLPEGIGKWAGPPTVLTHARSWAGESSGSSVRICCEEVERAPPVRSHSAAGEALLGREGLVECRGVDGPSRAVMCEAAGGRRGRENKPTSTSLSPACPRERERERKREMCIVFLFSLYEAHPQRGSGAGGQR